MKINKKKLTQGLAVLLIGSFLFYYFLNFFFKSATPRYKTQAAMSATMSDGVAVKGIAVRNEKVISGSKSANVNYLVESGTKISKKAPIAKAYPTSKDITVINKINELNIQIAALLDLQNKTTSVSPNHEGVSKPIYDAVAQVNDNLAQGSVRDMQSSKQNLTNTLNARDKKLGIVLDYTKQINALKLERSKLMADIKQPTHTIYAPASGYFVSYTDGFENAVTPQNIEQFTIPKLNELLEKQTVKTDYKVIGKMIMDYRWQFICTVDSKKSEEYSVGMKMKLNFPTENVGSVPVKISKIQREADQTLLILDADYLTASIALIRNQEAELSMYEYEGLRVPVEALRMKDGEKGVYVLKTGYSTFKRVEILYQNEQYMIVRMNSSDPNDPNKEYLKLYDEVILND